MMSLMFDKYLSKKLKDPKYKAEYDALEPEFTAIGEKIEARKRVEFSKRQNETVKRKIVTSL
jgi:hypothetical protein